ncbi:unnamed protein product [Mytilus coruscus]|uniref:Homeobox domain-containing protein n=1 Tax=Mytilus coruscus TaxID=42192 RepID=A0A6J8EDL3_MYTCO|nr:unnamed protein product [Mytilus coruscus]
MLGNQKPQRMAFTIENLAKSSRDESFPEVPLTFPNLPPIGFAPRLHLLDNCTPIKLQATVIPSMSTPKTNSKRKRNHSEVSDTESTTSSRSKSTSEESSESFSASISDSEDGSDTSGRRKKARTAFTTEQICDLEKRYHTQKYLPANERSVLAEKLKLSDQQVKTWFQNRRMKEKRQQRDDDQSRSFLLPTGGVDIAQLVAMGMPCPPPHNISGTNMLQLPGFIGAPHMISPHQMSTLSACKSSSAVVPGYYNSPYSTKFERSSPQLGHHSF